MSNKHRQPSNTTPADETPVVVADENENTSDATPEGMPIDELEDAISAADTNEQEGVIGDEAEDSEIIDDKEESTLPDATETPEEPTTPEIPETTEEDGDEEEPETPEQVTTEMATVKEILLDKTLTGAAKLEVIATHDIPKFKFLALKLVNYATTMSRNNFQNTPAVGAAANFDLYNIISNVINDEDYGSFKTSFDIINLAFKEYDNDAFSDIMLHRFSTNWSWSEEYYATFLSLATIISTLCNPVTRSTMVKSLDLTRAFNSKKQRFSQKAVENLSRYYKAK